jgi:hypothetical protein
LNCFNNLVTPAKDAAVVLLSLASVLVTAFVAGFVLVFVAGFVPDFVVDFGRGFVVVFAMIFPPLSLNGYCRGTVTTDGSSRNRVDDLGSF